MTCENASRKGEVLYVLQNPNTHLKSFKVRTKLNTSALITHQYMDLPSEVATYDRCQNKHMRK